MRIAVHNTAVKRTGSQINGVNNYHRNKWNMKSITGWYVGYNYFCDSDGTLTNTRKVGEETMANRGHNCDTKERCDIISFCFALNGDIERPNEAQIKTFKEFATKHDMTVTLHRDIQVNRTCPGSLITIEYLKGLLEDDGATEEAEKLKELQRKVNSIRAMLQRLLRLLLRK